MLYFDVRKSENEIFKKINFEVSSIKKKKDVSYPYIRWW